MCAGLACCAAGTACQCAARVVPAKIAYLAVLFLSCFAAFVFRQYGSEWISDFYSFQDGCEGDFEDVCRGMMGVYRISFTCFVSFALMSLVTRFSPSVHYGWWPFKFMGFVGLLVASFLLPNEVFDGYADFARIGSVLFIVLQILIIIDFAYDLHDFLVSRSAAYDAKLDAEGFEANLCGNPWNVAYIACCVVFLALTGVGIGLMYGEFPSCGRNTFFITETILVGILYTGASASAALNKGLLTPTIMWAHSAYLAWGAISSDPDVECNPTVNMTDGGSVSLGILIAAAALCWTAFRAAGAGYDLFRKDDASEEKEVAVTVEMPAAEEKNGDPEAGEGGGEGAKDAKSKDGDGPPPDPTAWFFHLVMALASLYLGMLLTNWGNVDGEPLSANPEVSTTSMWVKIFAQWVSYLLYFWTLFAPLICPGRDFGDTHNSFGS